MFGLEGYTYPQPLEGFVLRQRVLVGSQVPGEDATWPARSAAVLSGALRSLSIDELMRGR